MTIGLSSAASAVFPTFSSAFCLLLAFFPLTFSDWPVGTGPAGVCSTIGNTKVPCQALPSLTSCHCICGVSMPPHHGPLIPSLRLGSSRTPFARLTTTWNRRGFTCLTYTLARSPDSRSSAARHAARSSQSPAPSCAVSDGNCQISFPTLSRRYLTPDRYSWRCGFARRSRMASKQCKSASACNTFASASTVSVGRSGMISPAYLRPRRSRS